MSFNITIDKLLEKETIGLGIVHSDFLLSQADSKTKSDVTQLLHTLPDELQDIAINDFGFLIVSEKEIYNYMKNNVLTSKPKISGMFDELQVNFLHVLHPSFVEHFPGAILSDYSNGISIKDHDLIDEIAKFASSKLILSSRIKVNDTRVVVDSHYDVTDNYSNKILGIDWVKLYKKSIQEIMKIS